VLIAPLALFPWNLAYALWLTVNVGLFLTMLGALLKLAHFPFRDSSAALLIAAILALAPFHTGIVTGNVALVAVELGVIAVWTTRQRHEIMTAIFIAASVGLKPQIGLCFLLFYLRRGHWRVSGLTLAFLILLGALGILRLEIGHTPWLASYLIDNRSLLETGTLANFTRVNPTRFGLINLQVVLFPLLGSIRSANFGAVSVSAIFFVIWLFAMRRTANQADFELLDLSAIAIISLLPIYHRFYDAALLVLPLCWVFLSFRKARIFGTLSLLLMLPFLIPGGTILETMQANRRIPLTWASRWWWELFVMPHQVWMLLLLSLLLLYEMTIYRLPPAFREYDRDASSVRPPGCRAACRPGPVNRVATVAVRR